MTDFRRTLLWVVFTFSLFLIWDAWNKHNGQPSMFNPAPVVAAASAPQAASAPGGEMVGVAAVASAPAASAAVVVPSQKVTISTDLMQATLDTKGGQLVRVELLQQHEQHQADLIDRVMGKAVADTKKNVVVLDQSKDRYYTAQTGLWPSQTGPGQMPEHHTVMALVGQDRVLKDGADTLQVRFESPEQGGVKLVKTYTFTRGDYAIGVKHEIVNISGAAVSPRLYLQLVRDGNPIAGGTSFDSTFTGPAVYTEASKFNKLDFKDLDKNKAEFDKAADNGWVSMVQHYFAAAWLVGAPQQREFFAGKVPNTSNEYTVGMFFPLGDIAAGASKTFDAKLYVGPQEDKRLKGLSAVAADLESVRDYGRLSIIAKPLFWLMSQLHTLLGNWGWSIVVLVLLLKIAFYGLTASGYRSMAKMKSVGPRIAELTERYKDEPQKKSQEMMRIYREEKINPIGGCLPILVQMPFFIALYSVLLSSVEMRNAPWVWWITDLSAKDPYYILPLLMTLTTLLQTWLNPTPPDPMQAKMMWIMPLVFSVMFFTFPSGLVLYWLTNNILSIAQQYLINKQLGVLGK